MATVKDQRLVFNCPACDNVIRARPETAGLTGKCVRCGHAFTIPDKSDPVEAPAPVVEDKPALYPPRTKGPPRHPASAPPVANLYHGIGMAVLFFGGAIITVALVSLIAAAISPGYNSAAMGLAVFGITLGVTLCVSSVPMLAIATLIRDTRTTADCMRHLIDRVEDWNREGQG